MYKSKGLRISKNTPEEEQSGKFELRWHIISTEQTNRSIKQSPQKDPHVYRTLTYDSAGTENQCVWGWREKRFFSKLYSNNHYLYEKIESRPVPYSTSHSSRWTTDWNGKGKTINIWKTYRRRSL